MSGEVDLEILGDDLAFGPDGEPLFIKGADVVEQDLAHRLRESGLPVGLVADDTPVSVTVTALKTEVEKDTRLAPGTVKVAEGIATGVFEITADTLEGEEITANVNA